MRTRPAFRLAVAVGLSMVLAGPASASFYLMQIEQAISGVDGDTSARTIELRMRSPGKSTATVVPEPGTLSLLNYQSIDTENTTNSSKSSVALCTVAEQRRSESATIMWC